MLLAAALSLSAQAATPAANPGRPSFSDNASATAAGAMELELGTAFEPDSFSTNYVLKFGMHPRLDLRIGFEDTLAPVRDPGAFTFLMKGTLIQPRNRVVGAAIAPFVTVDPGTGQPGFGTFLIASYPQGDVQIDANLLLDAHPSGSGGFRLDLDPVLTVGFPLAGDLGGYVEAYGIIPTYDQIQPALGLAFGLGYELRKNIILDASFDAGLLNQDLLPPWKAQIGVTFSGYLIQPEREANNDGNSGGNNGNGKNNGKKKNNGNGRKKTPNSTLR